MDRVAQNKKLLAMAGTISKAIEDETEEILEHAEAVIKKYIPARYVKAALTKMEKMLDTEGIEASFDKAITREALRKTASTKVTAKELHQTIATVADAIVAEMEDVLNDADSVAKETISKFDARQAFEVESKMKGAVEKKMASKGVYICMERTAKKPNKIADRIAKYK